MLIFHHSSKTNELRNVQGSIKTASVSTCLSWPNLINYRDLLCVVLVVAACYLLQLTPPKLNRLNRSNAMTISTANYWNLVTLIDTNSPYIYLERVG